MGLFLDCWFCFNTQKKGWLFATPLSFYYVKVLFCQENLVVEVTVFSIQSNHVRASSNVHGNDFWVAINITCVDEFTVNVIDLNLIDAYVVFVSNVNIVQRSVNANLVLCEFLNTC